MVVEESNLKLLIHVDLEELHHCTRVDDVDNIGEYPKIDHSMSPLKNGLSLFFIL